MTGPYSRCTNPAGRGFCGGEVVWELFPGRWRGTCQKCSDQRRAATGEANALSEYHGRSVEQVD